MVSRRVVGQPAALPGAGSNHAGGRRAAITRSKRALNRVMDASTTKAEGSNEDATGARMQAERKHQRREYWHARDSR